jgi:predicted RNA binding protein YcfA (HicA-like mRNA interferase family)
MAKLPSLNPKRIIRALKRAGFYVHHQTGSHARLLHSARTELRVTVPIHNRDLKPWLVNEILRQADLTAEEFRELL